MYSGFNLMLKDEDFAESLTLTQGKNLYLAQKIKMELQLDSFFDARGNLNAAKMQEIWFPSIDAQIFISHSHKDKDTAIRLSGWLKNALGLDSFIDSCVWGYADHLLKMIDNEFCLNPSRETYSYEKRNRSTSHVHMMLSTALSKMMDKIECLVFLNTPSSISPASVIGEDRTTDSPWLYSEIAMTRLIRRKHPAEHRPYTKVAKTIARADALDESLNLRISYPMHLDHLISISKNDLYAWKDLYLKNHMTLDSPLDALYKLKKIS